MIIATSIFLALCLAAYLWPRRIIWHQCAWCKWWVSSRGHITPTRPTNFREPISHGICPDCAGKVKGGMNRQCN